jgi:inner membrane protein
VPSVFSHAVAAFGIGACFYRPEIPKQVWIVGAVCAALPDMDVVGFSLGVRYGDFWGHRGFTHSFLFAALLAGAAALGLRSSATGMTGVSLWLYLFLATASHGVLDAMTDGGLGVALFSPFDTRRYFLPWRPIEVAPIGIARFFTARGWEVLRSELVWIWAPVGVVRVLAWLARGWSAAE